MQKAKEADAGVLDYAVPEGRSKEQSPYGVWAFVHGLISILGFVGCLMLALSLDDLWPRYVPKWLGFGLGWVILLASTGGVILGAMGTRQRSMSRKMAIAGLVLGAVGWVMVLLDLRDLLWSGTP